MKARILIVDDEPDLREILAYNLESDAYEVICAESALDAQKAVEGNNIDLILLDVMMSPKSGFEWASELKMDERTKDIPIIFCTAKTMEHDILKGFSLGSDDYICKPFRISEVKARIKAVLSRCHNERAEQTLRFEGLELNMEKKSCTVDGIDVQFSKLEFEILVLLISKPGQVFSREEILRRIWPDNTMVLDRTVDVNITRIRKKIGPYGSRIRTRFGYGYFFDT